MDQLEIDGQAVPVFRIIPLETQCLGETCCCTVGNLTTMTTTIT